MADKAISELVSAEQITANDMFVLEQNGTAKKLTGQVLLNWLTAAADGHGGIQSIVKRSTSGLADTYRITLADTTVFDFVVTNGRGISSLQKTGTSGLVDTYAFTYNDGTKATFTVTNGQKGDKGDNAYIWVKYASQEPTASSHSFGDLPDDWMGVYFGTSSTAPTNWQQYKWYKIKGEKGETGEPAVRLSVTTAYQVGDAGNIIPSGPWLSSIPYVAQGKYLWIRKTTVWNKGDPDVDYSVSRMGIDGTGAVSTVAGVGPDATGNVPLDASSVKALPIGGGIMEGPINMNGQPIGGLNAPTENDQAANMGFVNEQMKKAAPRNLLDNSDFRNPVNQRGETSYKGNVYTIDRWRNQSQEAAATILVESNCVKIVNNATQYNTIFLQMLEKLPPGIYTFAVCTNHGITVRTETITEEKKDWPSTHIDKDWWINFNTSETYPKVRIVNTTPIASTLELYWAALYEGEYDADNLPVYQSKGYSVELLECQRYFLRVSTSPLGNGYTKATGGAAQITVPIPIKMRVYPSFPSGSYIVRCNGTDHSTTDISVLAMSNSGVQVVLTKAGIAAREAMSAFTDIANFGLSADL